MWSAGRAAVLCNDGRVSPPAWLRHAVLAAVLAGVGCTLKIEAPNPGSGGAASSEGGSSGGYGTQSTGGAGGSLSQGGISADCQSCAGSNCSAAVSMCDASQVCLTCVATDFPACIAVENVEYLAVCECAQQACPSCAAYCPVSAGSGGVAGGTWITDAAADTQSDAVSDAQSSDADASISCDPCTRAASCCTALGHPADSCTYAFSTSCESAGRQRADFVQTCVTFTQTQGQATSAPAACQ
jgi:hypothetical protein